MSFSSLVLSCGEGVVLIDGRLDLHDHFALHFALGLPTTDVDHDQVDDDNGDDCTNNRADGKAVKVLD